MSGDFPFYDWINRTQSPPIGGMGGKVKVQDVNSHQF
jgi:hypothetical protein